MNIPKYTLLALVEYLAIGAGILVATSGREKLLAAVIPLALVLPFWFLERRRSRHRQREDTQSVDDGAT